MLKWIYLTDVKEKGYIININSIGYFESEDLTLDEVQLQKLNIRFKDQDLPSLSLITDLKSGMNFMDFFRNNEEYLSDVE